MKPPLSRKQIEAIRNSTAKINIFEGPVRAGKSYAALLAFIMFCIGGIKGEGAICGYTEKSIKRNVIFPLKELLGASLKYFPHKGEVWIGPRLCHVISASKEEAQKSLTGSTLACILIDEVVLLPESFFAMAITRVSLPGSKIIATCNPDSAHHWLKRNFIDRGEEAETKVFSFTLEDNPSLDAKYIDFLHKQYAGVWKERMVYGKWVMAEGSVFPFFTESEHLISEVPEAMEYIVGVDYGINNPTVFLLIGHDPGAADFQWWVEKEYYYDSNVEGNSQKSDHELIHDFKEFTKGYYVNRTYVDPSALSLKREMSRQRLERVFSAENDVVPGVRFMTQLLSKGQLKIHKSCTQLVKEIHNYSWDRKAALKGEDKPVKREDHAVDALRYGLFSRYFSRNPSFQTTEYYEDLTRNYRWG